eukprot:5486251-Pyramimonas_sp.AAC.1
MKALKTEIDNALAAVMARYQEVRPGRAPSAPSKEEMIAAENEVLRRHARRKGIDAAALNREVEAAQRKAEEAAAARAIQEEETAAANDMLKQQLQLQGTDMAALGAK